MLQTYRVPLNWALEQAGTVAQLWLRDNAPKTTTPEEFADLFLDATFRITCKMTGKNKNELMKALDPVLDDLISTLSD